MWKVCFSTELGAIEESFHSLDLAQKHAQHRGYKILRAKWMNSKERKSL